MKYGAPTREIIRPAGIWAGATTVRPRASATQTSSPPSSIETGITRPCLAPTSDRARCGATSPTKPTTPTAITLSAASTAAIASAANRVRSGLTPTTRGVSSSTASRSSRCRMPSSTGSASASAAATGTTSGSVRP